MHDDDLPAVDPMAEAIELAADMARGLAAFTAQCENNGYSRAEAIRLTGEYLRALVMRGGGS